MARIFLILTLLFSLIGRPATAQNTTKGCKKPLKIVTQPSFSGEDKKKWKGKSVHGRIAIVINEAGDVIQAQVVAASPIGVEQALVDAAKRAKFQARTGCGELKSYIAITGAHHTCCCPTRVSTKPSPPALTLNT